MQSTKLVIAIASVALLFGTVFAAEPSAPAKKKMAGSGTRADVSQVTGHRSEDDKPIEKIKKTDKEWRKQLSRKQFEVARKGGTEQAFTGRFWKHKVEGTYQCVCCEQDLFPSKAKFKSGTGWPSFFAPVGKKNVAAKVDKSLFMTRTEVLCSRCDAHLGHVFKDGPRPTGLRFCINSASLTFESVKAREKRLAAEKSKLEESAEEVEDESEAVAKPAK